MIWGQIHVTVDVLQKVPIVDRVPHNEPARWVSNAEEIHESAAVPRREDREEMAVLEYKLLISVLIQVLKVCVRLLVLVVHPIRRLPNYCCHSNMACDRSDPHARPGVRVRISMSPRLRCVPCRLPDRSQNHLSSKFYERRIGTSGG